MTTDCTSATINQNIKTEASKARTFKAANTTLESGAFESVFENVSKSYTDKSAVKNSKQETNYAQKTKDVSSAKKSAEQAKTRRNNNSQSKTQNDTTAKNSEYNKQTEADNKNNLQNAENETIKEEPNFKEETAVCNEENVVENDIAQQLVAEPILANITFNGDKTQALIERATEETQKNIEETAKIIEEVTAVNTTEAVSELLEEAVNNSAVQQFAEALEANIENNFQEALTTKLNTEVLENAEKSIDVEIASDKIKTPEVEVQSQKTAEESLNADTSRITINLEKENSEEPVLMTPDRAQSQETEEDLIPLIQVTDEVAEGLKNFTEKAQNRDFAGKVKDKITARLGDIISSSTVVTEVQNAQSSFQSGMNANSQGNTALAQGNAAEQAIKMSIENLAENETSADSFISQLEAKLNAGAKTAEVKTANQTLNKSDIMSQLNAKFNEMQQAGQSKVSIILRPENLGRVSLEIMNSKEGIIAKMTTDNQQVRDLLNKNIESLRANLSSQGVNVNNIKVECTNQSENNAMDFERHQFEQNSQNFQGEGRNSHTNHSNQSNETTFWNGNSGTEEAEETNETANIETEQQIANTNNTTTHNGKIDYKV